VARLIVASLLILHLIAKRGALADPPAATPLFFDGKTLAGWEGLTSLWQVRNGSLVGSTYPRGVPFTTFLCSRQSYKDFELSFSVRLKDGIGNSGVQFRSVLIDARRFAVKGPQADIGESCWGSLYGEFMPVLAKQAPRDVVERALKPKDFNDYWVRCVGKRCTIRLNGVITVNDNFPAMPDEGIIAWQLHAGGPMDVVFKDIHFIDLSRR
jgi:hypothetical protein